MPTAYRQGRTGKEDINGFLVVDKPIDVSSARVVNQVKRILQVKKAGHTGTLDPFATGVLVCGLNQATRLTQFLLQRPKRYEAVLCLGIETDTLDHTGTVIAESRGISISDARIHGAAARFIGTIWQSPPAFSALKHQGVPLYRYAREGRAIKKPDRQVTVYDLRIVDIQLPTIRLDIRCSAGTYIRSLCADMGRVLGCGGHLCGLRRTSCSGFDIDEAVALRHLASEADAPQALKRIVPMAEGLRGLPQLSADDRLRDRILRGQPLQSSPLADQAAGLTAGPIKIIDRNNDLLAVIRHDPASGQLSYGCVFPK